MAIKGIQIPMYTKHTLFLYFSDFSIFFSTFMKNKIKQNWKETNKNILNKAKYKTRLTQNKKAKHTSNANKNKKEREREKWLNHFEPFSFHTLEELFYFVNPWFGDEGEELKPFKFERNIRALSRSPSGAKKGGNWFWFPDEIIQLLCWVANHL